MDQNKIQTKWLIDNYEAKTFFEVEESKQNKIGPKCLIENYGARKKFELKWLIENYGKKHVVSNWSDRKVYETDSIQFVMPISKL